MKKIVVKAFPAVSCGLFVFFVYLYYLAPDIVSGDGADLIGQAYLFGVCHQTGYPITVMAGKLFTWLPFGTIPLRVNLLSAVSAAVAVSFVVLTLFALLQSTGAAFAGGIFLGLCPLFWARSEAANVHMFSAMLISVYIFLFILFLVRGNYLLFLAGMFLFGLSWAAHMQNLLHVPAIGWIILVKRKELPWKILIYGLCLFLLGLTPYIWMMERAAVVPPFSTYQSPTTPMRLIEYIFGASTEPWHISSIGKIWEGVLLVSKVYAGSFLIIGLPLMVLGFFYLWRLNKNAGIFFALICGANTSFFIHHTNYYFSLFNHTIPSAMVMAIWMAAGAESIYIFIRRHSPKAARLTYCALLSAWMIASLLLFPSTDFSQWFQRKTGHGIPAVNWRNVREAREFIVAMDERLPQNSVIVTPWAYFALLRYAQEVEGIRRDLQLVLHSETKDVLQKIGSEEVAMEALHSSQPIFYVDGHGVMPLRSNTAITEMKMTDDLRSGNEMIK